jgi:hypothetical protein
MNSKLIRILSTIIGTVIFIVILVMVFRIIGSRASNFQPTNVTITDIMENSAKVTWETGDATLGAIKYGTTQNSLNFYAPETNKDLTKNHSVGLTLLSPESTYFFEIQIGDKLYTNADGSAWSFTTKSKGGGQSTIPTAGPTPTAASTTPTVTPIQTLQISPTPVAGGGSACGSTDCDSIKANLGKGCTVTDLVRNNCLAGETTPTTAP